MLSTKLTSEAPVVWKHLNGILNLYKPAGISFHQLRTTILGNLCRDLNSLDVRPPSDRVEIIPAPTAEQNYIVRRVPDLADLPLVVGPRYIAEDFKFRPAFMQGAFTSGICVVGLNKCTWQANKMHENRPMRVYHVSGRLGKATESHFVHSRVTAKAKHQHVHFDKLQQLLGSIQATHQHKMYDICGVDIQSEAAYQLACKGLIRPAEGNIPVLYSIKCVDFAPPDFTLEIYSINESEAYFGILINEIGIELRTWAHCTKIRRIRYGHFTLDTALTREQWNLQDILDNIVANQRLIKEHPEILKDPDAKLKDDNKD